MPGSAVSVLFSEPKIPQFTITAIFVGTPSLFQCSSASRKFLNSFNFSTGLFKPSVSVLFSEPKIPQFQAELLKRYPTLRFQCSSASRKFLNFRYPKERTKTAYSFSALQRAENSSIPDCTSIQYSPARFQCSSASRKFLNRHCARFLRKNRSIVSVLFSEPKIPQSAAEAAYPVVLSYVSVLFSEPKIPQSVPVVTRRPCNEMFQCSSASRKFLNCSGCDPHAQVLFAFQCSSASRKFLNLD